MKLRHRRQDLMLRYAARPSEPTSKITRTISVAAEPRIVAMVSRAFGATRAGRVPSICANQKKSYFAAVNRFERFGGSCEPATS